ncbi:Mitochondrial distribution and morphology protein 12 [Umbelopsis sp. WA50703]
MSTALQLQDTDPSRLTSFHLNEPVLAQDSESVITKLYNRVKSVVGPEHTTAPVKDNDRLDNTEEAQKISEQASIKSTSRQSSGLRARDDASITDTVHSVASLPAEISHSNQVKATDLLSSFLSERSTVEEKSPPVGIVEATNDRQSDGSAEYSPKSSKSTLNSEQSEADSDYNDSKKHPSDIVEVSNMPKSQNIGSLHFVEPDQDLLQALPIRRTTSKDSDTQSVATTFSVSNTNSLRSVISRLRGHKSDKEFWMPDENCKECYACRRSFTFLRRKHHCRICGQIFCAKCASHIISGKQFKQKGEVRVCNFCYENLDNDNVDNQSALSLGSLVVDSSVIDGYAPVVPDQKAPVAAPKLQISTTALKQSRDSYGAQDTPTVAVEFQADSMFDQPSAVSDQHKGNDLLSPSDAPFAPHTHHLSSFDGYDSRLTRTESNNSIRPRLRASTSGSQGSGDERPEILGLTSPFPFRSEIASPALEAASSRHGSEYGGSPFIDKDEDESEENSVMWSNRYRSTSSELPINGLGIYKMGNDPDSPSSANDLRAHDGSLSDRNNSLIRQSESETSAKHKMGRRYSFTVTGKPPHNRSSPLWRNMKNMKINTRDLPNTIKTSSLSADVPTVSDSQFMPFSPFHHTDVIKWSSAELFPFSRSPSTARVEGAASTSLQMKSELSIATMDRLKVLLHQLLEDSPNLQTQTSVITKYEETVFNLLLEMVAAIKPDIRGGDDMDLRHYVKIKKIPGGTPGDSRYVEGVVCSKNVAHKQMMRDIDNPRILILLFPVEYSRVGNQLLSLEPVLSQEKEHLKKLVARIIALKPSIVLTKYSVSRFALEYLLEANIVVVHNMKKSVLQAIARCTGASLIPSIDKFTSDELSLGHCGRFKIKTFVHEMIPNRRKTYLFFDQCSPDLGGTIVIRGADQSTLTAIKRIVDFMCYVAHSSKLETFLLRDSFAKSKSQAITGNDDSKQDDNSHSAQPDASDFVALNNDINRSNITAENTTTAPMEHHVEKAIQRQNAPLSISIEDTEDEYKSIEKSIQMYKDAILSISPFVIIPPPYLLMKIKEVEHKTLDLERLISKEEAELEHVITPSITPSSTPVSAVFDTKLEASNGVQAIAHMDVVSSPLKDELDLLMDQKHQLSRAWYTSMPDIISHLTAYHHQHLVVLYFNVCTVTTVPCHGPEPLLFQYYNQNSDITLGHYLEDMCANAERKCSSNMCKRPELLHYRSYVHGQARINVMMENFECPQPGMTDIILMWSFCKRCNNPTPVVPMSQSTWNYSFGKFLELSLYQTNVQCRADICPHDIARDHVRYFGFKNLAVRFQYDEIDLLEVAPPPMKLVMFTKVHSKLREDQYQKLRTKITAFYHSIIERNKHFNMSIIDPTKADVAKKELAEMSENAAAEMKSMLQGLQSIYATTYSTDILGLNQIIFHMVKNASTWDQAYLNLLRSYLAQDTDIGKLATSGWKALLPADKVIDTDARAERAIRTFDLPVLDVGLDSVPGSRAQGVPIPGEDDNLSLVPDLGTSPSHRYTDADQYQLDDDVILPSSLARRLSLELMKSSTDRAVEAKKYIPVGGTKLSLIDPTSSSIITRRQARLSKDMSLSNDGKSVSKQIPILLSLTDNAIGNTIRRREHPIFSIIRDSPLSVATPDEDRGFSTAKQSPSDSHTARYREALSRGSSYSTQDASGRRTSRLPSTYLPLYVERFRRGSTPLLKEMQSKGSNRQTWVSELRQARTSMQVYDTANDLVMENVDQEFGEGPLTPGPPNASRKSQVSSSTLLQDAMSSEPYRPRTDYFDPGSVRETGSDRATSTPRSPHSITDFFVDSSTTHPHGSDRNQEAPLSHSPTMQATLGSDLDIGDVDETIDLASASSLDTEKDISRLLERASEGSDQTTFMKALTVAMSEIAFSKLQPLEYPFTQTDHIFPDSLVIVKEDVPSTIIAYTLSCEDYLDKMQTIHEGQEISRQSDYAFDKTEHQHADWLELAPTKDVSASTQASGMERALLSDTGTHMRYQFSDGSTRFFCKAFFSEQFEALRQNCGCSEKYITSLASSVEWDSSGGKSGSAFLKTTGKYSGS